MDTQPRRRSPTSTGSGTVDGFYYNNNRIGKHQIPVDMFTAVHSSTTTMKMQRAHPRRSVEKQIELLQCHCVKHYCFSCLSLRPLHSISPFPKAKPHAASSDEMCVSTQEVTPILPRAPLTVCPSLCVRPCTGPRYVTGRESRVHWRTRT